MAGKGVEELYKNYGILADAGEKISEVSEVSMTCFSLVMLEWLNSCYDYFPFKARLHVHTSSQWEKLYTAFVSLHLAQRCV